MDAQHANYDLYLASRYLCGRPSRLGVSSLNPSLQCGIAFAWRSALGRDLGGKMEAQHANHDWYLAPRCLCGRPSRLVLTSLNPSLQFRIAFAKVPRLGGIGKAKRRLNMQTTIGIWLPGAFVTDPRGLV